MIWLTVFSKSVSCIILSSGFASGFETFYSVAFSGSSHSLFKIYYMKSKMSFLISLLLWDRLIFGKAYIAGFQVDRIIDFICCRRIIFHLRIWRCLIVDVWGAICGVCSIELSFDLFNGLGHLDQALLDGLPVHHLAWNVVLPFANCRWNWISTFIDNLTICHVRLLREGDK